MAANPDRPLTGLKVLDLSRVLAGPYCAMLLGDLGAEVIKVEEPIRGDETRTWGPPYTGGESAYYLGLNRNKRGMTLNLKHPDGIRILDQLIVQSDVLIQNFKAGTLERLGRDDEALARMQPRLVRLAISGFGPDGPYRDRPAYDFVLQAMVGLMSITGEPEGEPMRLGVAVVDVVTALYSAVGVLGALSARERTGRGQRVDVSLLESGVAMLVNIASNYLNSGKPPTRHGNAHANIVPYQTFRASNGYIAVAIGNDGQFVRLCEILGSSELARNPKYATNQARVANRGELLPILQQYFGRATVGHWTDALLAAGLPSGPINTVDQVFDDPQVLAREMVQHIAHPTAGTIGMVGFPFKFSENPPGIDRHPPLHGEHTDELLQELGYSMEDITRLRADGAI
ncbi:MAG: Formyl-CoA transferase [Chloroflexi bacterium]|nr:Formyl-CoA transferase [Chloroflexota bacterium]